MNVSYVLPILRRPGEGSLDELTLHLRWLSSRVELIVVDGSDEATFDEAHILWNGAWVHVPPDPGWSYLNGKVNGVHTGMGLVTRDAVIIADDDVRYDEAALEAMATALSGNDLVIPQNHFDPLPWHAGWDTARTLLNRCFGTDSPGTLGVRATAFRAVGGYDGDVMYENLELIRTVAGAGGRVDRRPDIHVRRLPPTTRRFLEQRPRQAYDDLAQPLKFSVFLSALPLVALARRRRSFTRLAACVAVAGWAAAAVGRRRHGGRAVFPIRAVWWTPVWLLERSVCVWIALFHRLGGGAPYNGNRLSTAAHSQRRLHSTLLTDLEQHAAPPTGSGGLVSSSPGSTEPADLPLTHRNQGAPTCPEPVPAVSSSPAPHGGSGRPQPGHSPPAAPTLPSSTWTRAPRVTRWSPT
jgi:hypothetical protein